MMLRPVLIPGHGVRYPSGYKPGACADLNGDGRIEPSEHEATLVRTICDRIVPLLRSHGAEPIVLAGSGYRSAMVGAAHMAQRNPRDLVPVIHVHLNAAAGRHRNEGIVFADSRSAGGTLLARCIESAWANGLPLSLRTDGVRRVNVDVSSPGGWASAASLIQPVWSAPGNQCGILIEPGFMDRFVGMSAAQIGETLGHIAHTTVAGIVQWYALRADGGLA